MFNRLLEPTEADVTEADAPAADEAVVSAVPVVADEPADRPLHLYLRWVGDGSRAVPGLPMGDVTLEYDAAMQMVRTGLWEVADEPTEA